MEFSDSMLSSFIRPLTGSAIREIFKLLQKPGMISFAGGNPSANALEPDVISDMAQAALKKYGADVLQYGATEGFAPYRACVAEFLRGSGIEVTEECVLPTQGSQQGLDLLVKAMVDPGDAILVESPTFLGALQTMRTYGAKIYPVETDESGALPEALEQAIIAHKPKLVYLIPTFQNPTGKTLPIERRKAFAQIAARHGTVFIEDDPYRDLRYSGEPVLPIKAFDEEGWIVYLSSFSKLISPGLRVGAAVVTNPLLRRKMIIGKQSTDVHSPTLNQAIIAEYLSRGLLPAHIESICDGYRAQMDAMLKKFSAFPEGVRHTSPEGGLFVWAELPEGMDAVKLLPGATERGVAYVPGTYFYPEGGHLETLRLNFSNSPVERIERGMDILNEIIREAMAHGGRA